MFKRSHRQLVNQFEEAEKPKIKLGVSMTARATEAVPFTRMDISLDALKKEKAPKVKKVFEVKKPSEPRICEEQEHL
jgi:hypothetical protein